MKTTRYAVYQSGNTKPTLYVEALSVKEAEARAICALADLALSYDDFRLEPVAE